MLSVRQFASLKKLSRSRVQQLILERAIQPAPIRVGDGKGMYLIARQAKIKGRK